MAVQDQRTSGAHAGVFEQINQFIGHHSECADVGESVRYRVALRDASAQCTVTVTCVCGATESFRGREDEGRALGTAARMHDIPTVQTAAE
jgi:hypothetical protein